MFPKGKERQPDREKIRTKNIAFKVTEKELARRYATAISVGRLEAGLWRR